MTPLVTILHVCMKLTGSDMQAYLCSQVYQGKRVSSKHVYDSHIHSTGPKWFSKHLKISTCTLSNIQYFMFLSIFHFSHGISINISYSNRCSHKHGNIPFPPRPPSSPITHPNSTIKKPLNSFSHFWTRMVCPIVEICLASGFRQNKIRSTENHVETA